MLEKVLDDIVLRRKKIKEMQKIQEVMKEQTVTEIKFKIKTKHWVGLFEPMLTTERQKLLLSKETMQEILTLAIQKEEKEIKRKLAKLKVNQEEE